MIVWLTWTLLFMAYIGDVDTKRRQRHRIGRFKKINVYHRNLEVVDGGWSHWGLYSLCNSITCTETWARYCNEPRPKNGGATCPGDSHKKLSCRDTSLCKTDAPTTPSQEDAATALHWSKWGPCSVTCGVGTRSRTMLPCDGSSCDTQEQPCVKVSCSTVNGFDEWSSWSDCEACIQTRSRACATPAICSSQVETDTQRCTCSTDETMTLCQTELADHISFGLLGYRVVCSPGGLYVPRQCDTTTEKCWCVDVNSGQHIYGTYHPHTTTIYDCDSYVNMPLCQALLKVSEVNIGADRPGCDEDGNFQPLQVSLEEELQWCVYSDGLEVPGSRTSTNDDINCDKELSRQTKCEATPEAKCIDGGHFDRTQCVEVGDWNICRCVYADGKGKDNTETTFPSVPECSVYPELSLTKCRAMSIKWGMSCLPSGEFASEHCSDINSICYCVKSDGSILDGSQIPLDARRRTSCQALIKMGERIHGTGNGETAHPISIPITYPNFSTSGTLASSPRTFPSKPTASPFDGSSFGTALPPIWTFSAMSTSGLDELNFVPYDEWSAWIPCSVDCGGGFQSKSRTCPVPGGLCGGPDLSQIWNECNTFPCIESVIETFEYTWSEDDSHVIVLCKAVGLPQPYMVIRDEDGVLVSEEQEQEDAYSIVRYNFTPTSGTAVMCVATGEGQDREFIDVHTVPGGITDFTTSAEAIYLGQEVSLTCSVFGLPRPTIRIEQDGVFIKEANTREVSHVFSPKGTSSYTCSAVVGGAVVGTQSLDVFVVDPCLGVECSLYSSCVVEDDTSTSCVCDTCPETGGDLDVVQLVCGSDCSTYLNVCAMNKASCLDGTSLSAIFHGSCSQIEKPVIYNTCKAERVYEGADVTLTCDARDIPDSEIVWYLDGSAKPVGYGSKLVLTGLTTADTGDYTCNVVNCGGNTHLTCPVIVEKKNMEECIQYGAGHFHQFSGFGFNYPGICHYILAMDCIFGSFYIYTGTSQCGSDAIPLAYASSITAFVGRDAVVILRGFDVNEFGVMKHLHRGEELLYQNFRIWRDVEMMHLKHRDTEFTLSWDGITVVTLSMPKTYAGRLCGLCGDVGMETPNVVEDVQGHGAMYEVDRYNTCNVADIPENTCSDQTAQDNAEKLCRDNLYSAGLSKCHGKVDVAEFMDSCVFDTCGVHWYEAYKTGLCNVLSAYAHLCIDIGVDLTDWRDDTPCPFAMMQRVAYLSKKKRRRKRSAGFSDFDIMMHGD